MSIAPEDARRASDRERAKRYRRRQRVDGTMCVLLTLPRAELEDLMIDLGFLEIHSADDREAVRNAAEAFVRAAILARAAD